MKTDSRAEFEAYVRVSAPFVRADSLQHIIQESSHLLPEAARPALDTGTAAPRHDLAKNQAAPFATYTHAGQLAELRKQAACARLSGGDLSKVAFWRSVVWEQYKALPEEARRNKLALFDARMQDPAHVKMLPAPTIDVGAAEKAQSRGQQQHDDEPSP